VALDLHGGRRRDPGLPEAQVDAAGGDPLGRVRGPGELGLDAPHAREHARRVDLRGVRLEPEAVGVAHGVRARADARKALDGTQPVHRQSPPTRSRSTAQTFRGRADAKLGGGHPGRAHADDDRS
jgi:hypothetical protein